MIARICKRNFFVPTMWSHTRNINVLQSKGIIRYEIPMYMDDEMEAKLVSVSKSKLGNTIVVEFCIENVEQYAPPIEAQVSELS